MPDYQQGKIYTIRCRNDDTLIYVGSTIQPLYKRWGGHKKDSLKHPNILLYQSIDNKWDEWYIELYELYPCNSKMELDKREGEVIRQIGTLNKRIEGRTHKEYYIENIDKIKERNKQYKIDNAEKIKEKMKQYKIENADKLKEHSKQYRIDNADKLKEHSKQYCIDNAEKIKEKMKQYYQRRKQKQNQAE